MKQFQCVLEPDALRRLANLQLFDSLVVVVSDERGDGDDFDAPRLRADVFLHGKLIARSELI